jgi:hypothetical protein
LKSASMLSMPVRLRAAFDSANVARPRHSHQSHLLSLTLWLSQKFKRRHHQALQMIRIKLRHPRPSAATDHEHPRCHVGNG